MAKVYHLGIIGFGHMHINNVAQSYNAHPQVEWIAFADTVPPAPERERRPIHVSGTKRT